MHLDIVVDKQLQLKQNITVLACDFHQCAKVNSHVGHNTADDADLSADAAQCHPNQREPLLRAAFFFAREFDVL